MWFRSLFQGKPMEMLHSTPQRRDADFEDLDAARAQADYETYVQETEPGCEPGAWAAMCQEARARYAAALGLPGSAL